MIADKRQNTIITILQRDRYAGVRELVRLLGSSPATIRRDLDRLEQRGQVRRVRGGAEWVGPEPAGSPSGAKLPFEARLTIQKESKRRIAARAAELCRDGQTVLIDGGSTTYYMADFLAGKSLRVITNSFAIAERLNRDGRCEVILPAGRLDRDTQLIINPFPEAIYANYCPQRVFLGAAGIDASGATNDDVRIIQDERAMIASSDRLVVLAEGNKFARRAPLKLCDLSRITTVITDRAIPRSQAILMAENEIEIITA